MATTPGCEDIPRKLLHITSKQTIALTRSNWPRLGTDKNYDQRVEFFKGGGGWGIHFQAENLRGIKFETKV